MRNRLPERSSIPLNAILVIPFLLEVLVAVGLTGFLSIRNGERAVQELAVQLQEETSSRIELHVERFLDACLRINRLNAEAIRLGTVDVDDPETLTQQFWRQMRVYSDLDFIYFGHEQRGGYAGVGRSTVNPWPRIEETEDYSAGDFLIYETDEMGDRQTLFRRDPDYDPRRRDWYKDAVEKGEMGWSEIYSFFPDLTLGISATLPLYDDEGELQGVVGSDLELDGLHEFLAQLNIIGSGQAFLIEPNGRIIASSHDQVVFAERPADGSEPARLLLSEMAEPILRQTGLVLQDEVLNTGGVREKTQLFFRHQGQKYFVQILPIENEAGLDWLVGIILPESAFMAQINANTRTTIGLCLLAMLVAMLLGIATSYWIKQRLVKLTKAAQAMARGELEQKIDATQLRELDDLGQSFNTMANQLKQVIRDLENSNDKLEKRVAERTAELLNTLTDLKQTQSQLIQTEKMSSLGQLVAGIAHEINNPLNFVSGNLAYTEQYTYQLLTVLSLYQEYYPQPEPAIAAYLREIDLTFVKSDFPNVIRSMGLGTERILKIVSSLKGFSHFNETEQKAVDIHRGIDSTLLILKGKLKATSNSREVELTKSYGKLPLVRCYPNRLNQVFMNLFSNAADALHELSDKVPDFEPKIVVTTGLTHQNQVEICVTDNGPGIPKGIQSRLYDPFFTTKPIGKGTGLGLSISFQIIVEQHGGTLNCISEPGKGTTFVILLPRDLLC